MVFCFWNRASKFAAACLAVLMMLFMASCSSTRKNSGGLPTHLPDIQLSGSTDTPPHSMASYEYPFDTNGRYVSDWAAEGERRAGRAATATSDDTTKWSRSHAVSSSSRKGSSSRKVADSDSDSKPVSSKSGSNTKSGSSSRKVADSDSDSKPSSSKSGSNSKSGSSTRKVADSDSKPPSSKTGSKPKPDSSSPKVANNDDEPTGTSKPALKRKPPSDDDVASNDPPKSSTSTKAKAKSTSSKSGRSYTVKSGDTLSHIAANYGTSVAKIKAANGMSSDFLSIGKVLRIP